MARQHGCRRPSALTRRVDIFSTPSFSSRPFGAPSPSATYSTMPTPAEPLIAHLLMEERFFALVATVSAAMQRVRNERYEPARLNVAEYAIEQFVVQAGEWREQVSLLNCTLSCQRHVLTSQYHRARGSACSLTTCKCYFRSNSPRTCGCSSLRHCTTRTSSTFTNGSSRHSLVTPDKSSLTSSART